MKTVRTGLAAIAATMIIWGQSGTATQAQTPDKPQAQAKPAAAAPAKPKPQPKPAAQKQTSAPELAGRKTVCVASAIGHAFRVQRMGIMVFGNSEQDVPVASWGIDELAVRRVEQVLGKEFAVRQVKVPQAALATFEAPSGPFSNPYPDFANAVRAAATSVGRCDYYVMVTRAGSAFANSNQALSGLGIFAQQTVLGDRVYMFASFAVRLHDGSNFAVLKTAVPRSDPLFSLTGAGIRAMYRQVDGTWWPATPQAAVQNAQLKNGTRVLLEEGLTKAVREVFEGA